MRPNLSPEEYDLLIKFRKGSLRPKPAARNVLVIGDIHEPFCLPGYLEFCQSLYKKYECNQVVFIGDVIDHHFGSFHETSTEGMGGLDELEYAISKLKRWYEAFPEAYVTIGNHDRLMHRKAQTAGIVSRWIRPYHEVLQTPKWQFVEQVEFDGVLYVHGEGGTARNRIKQELQSTVQGHLHTQAYIDWIVGAKYKVFGMQVGCGINKDSYAMAYAKAGKKPAISAGLVLDNGRLPVLEMMEL
jgi:metallophosphoesterase superfamily enzyme